MSGLLLALAFLSGVLLHDSGAGLILALPVAVVVLLGVVVAKDRTSRVLIGLSLVCIVLGAWRAESNHSQKRVISASLNGSNRYISATVIGIPRSTATRTAADISIETATNRTVHASLPLLPVVSDGDVIRFWAPKSWDSTVPGQVQIPVSSGGEVFIPSLQIMGTDASRIDRERTTITNRMTRAIEHNIPEPAGSLTLGIMTGDDSGMTNATRASFRAAGMSHITAVSGWNVAILTGFIIVVLRRLSPARTFTMILAIVTIWIYAFLVGMDPSVVRAAGMASIFLLAHWRGRPGDLLTALLLTTAIVVAITPIIRFDIGFQLSVAATLGIVLLLEISDSRLWWRSAIAVPLVAEMAVAPLLLHHLGTYSIVAPVANLVTAPLVELVMLGGAATVVGSFLHPAVGTLFGIVTWVPARLIVAVAEKSASFSWSSSTTETINWSTTLLVYLAMLAAYFGWQHWQDIQRYESQAESLAERI